jgi:hypothetical protein
MKKVVSLKRSIAAQQGWIMRKTDAARIARSIAAQRAWDTRRGNYTESGR